MTKFKVLFLFIASFSAHAQMIINQRGQAFSDEPYFNQAFILANGIKSFEGKISYKKSGDIIRETNELMRVEFDVKGRIFRITETTTDKKIRDTLYTFYEYDEFDNLTCFRKSEGGGLSAFYYFYEEGKMTKMEQRKDLVNAEGQIVKSILVNSEKYKYVTYDSILKKEFYNSYNLPYMEEFETTNELGYLTSITQKLKMADAKQTRKFGYNDKGLLNEVGMYYNKSDLPLTTIKFRYDDFGNVIERHSYQGEKFKEDFQIIYDPKTSFLSSIIILNKVDDLMKIVRFTDYQFN